MKNKERNQQEQLIEKAKAYFDAHGLATSLDAFFAKEEVKVLIHEKYASFVESIEEILTDAVEAELPEPITDRIRCAVEAVKKEDGEGKYADDVKLSVLGSMYNLFEGIETFVTVDESILAPFKAAFTGDDNAKLMETLNIICDGVVNEMMKNMVRMICVPRGLSEDIIDILMMIGGGMPMMNLEEMENMFGRHDDDDEDGDTEGEAAEAEEGNATC